MLHGDTSPSPGLTGSRTAPATPPHLPAQQPGHGVGRAQRSGGRSSPRPWGDMRSGLELSACSGEPAGPGAPSQKGRVSHSH